MDRERKSLYFLGANFDGQHITKAPLLAPHLSRREEALAEREAALRGVRRNSRNMRRLFRSVSKNSRNARRLFRGVSKNSRNARRLFRGVRKHSRNMSKNSRNARRLFRGVSKNSQNARRLFRGVRKYSQNMRRLFRGMPIGNFHIKLRSQELFVRQPLRLETKLTPISDPSMKVAFFLNGTPVQSSYRVQVLYQNEFALLSIAEVTEQDAGYYVCQAENEIGSAETSATVVVVTRTGDGKFLRKAKCMTGNRCRTRVDALSTILATAPWTFSALTRRTRPRTLALWKTHLAGPRRAQFSAANKHKPN